MAHLMVTARAMAAAQPVRPRGRVVRAQARHPGVETVAPLAAPEVEEAPMGAAVAEPAALEGVTPRGLPAPAEPPTAPGSAIHLSPVILTKAPVAVEGQGLEPVQGLQPEAPEVMAAEPWLCSRPLL